MSGKSVQRSLGFTLVELLVVIAIIGILVALLLPAVQMARESARRSQCLNNLKQIALAFQNYHDTYNKFPYGGDNGPMACCSADPGRYDYYNWTYHLLPFMERGDLYEAGTKNQAQLRVSPVPSYYCPTRRRAQLYQNVAKTDYAANAGTGSNGIVLISRNGVVGFRDVTDGTSSTMLVAEARIHRAYMDVTQAGYFADNEDCYTNGWLDDVVRDASKPPEPDLIDASLQGVLVHQQFGGSHPGGITSVFVDGSVHMIPFTIDLAVWQAACGRHDRIVFNFNDL